MLPRGPYLPVYLSLLVAVTFEQASDSILEEQWRTLQVRMELTIHKHTSIQVFLCSVTKVFVLVQDSLEEGINIFKVLIRSFYVSVNFVLHGAGCCRCRDASHHVEEMRPRVI